MHEHLHEQAGQRRTARRGMPRCGHSPGPAPLDPGAGATCQRLEQGGLGAVDDGGQVGGTRLDDRVPAKLSLVPVTPPVDMAKSGKE
jgi:hypothetical protein